MDAEPKRLIGRSGMAELALIEWNRLLNPPVPAILFGTLAGVAIVAVVGYFRLRAGDTRLKERMVEKGYSASEIGLARGGLHCVRLASGFLDPDRSERFVFRGRQRGCFDCGLGHCRRPRCARRPHQPRLECSARWR